LIVPVEGAESKLPEEELWRKMILAARAPEGTLVLVSAAVVTGVLELLLEGVRELAVPSVAAVVFKLSGVTKQPLSIRSNAVAIGRPAGNGVDLLTRRFTWMNPPPLCFRSKPQAG
jgi:hypothetical protein